MLKALELHGFKSFADKTRFVFPDGITVVVGPNGSGKSNIVDAMKWVLGEQSAKSLRGSEMADVIFKGSGGKGGRRPANTAEVTIVFDNKDRVLDVDTDEVHVTRRVYRSGEGEYLINGNPCRLRDIKDLFRGTGVGTDAYSLIEQGKVDTLLQASTKERRAIFEEAAGISRFKAKKVETQRRLERVEQNLTRLSDIVEEVETRLKTIKNQASKARRYKDYTERLKLLRTRVGFNDWQRFSQQLEAIEHELIELNGRHTELQDELRRSEDELSDFDRSTQQLADDLRSGELQIAQIRQEIAVQESIAQNQRKRLADHENEIRRYRRQLIGMTSRAGDLGSQVEHVESQLDTAEKRYQKIKQKLAERTVEIDAVTARLADLRNEIADTSTHQREAVKLLTELSRKEDSLTVEIQGCDEVLSSCDEEASQLASQIARIEQSHQELELEFDRLEKEWEQAKASVQRYREEFHRRETEQKQLTQDQIDLQQRFAVASERCRVLEDLEARREGLSAGVRDILTQAQENEYGIFAEVKGVVADLLRVDVGMAAAIDAVLGDLAQHVVTTGSQLTQAIATGQLQPNGRVGIIEFNRIDSQLTPLRGNLSGQRGVLGSCLSFVDTDPPFDALAFFLLRDTWCVETLADALRLKQEYPDLRFVSRHEEVVEFDGRILAGPRQSGIGIVSRRSELRTLKAELLELEARIEKTQNENLTLQTDLDSLQQVLHDATVNEESCRHRLTEKKLQKDSVKQQLKTLHDRLARVESQRDSTMQRRSIRRQQIESINEERAALQTQLDELEKQLADLDAKATRLAADLSSKESELTTAKVEFAKSEQQVDDLRSQLLRFEQDQRERQNAVREVEQTLETAEQRRRDAEFAILRATGKLAELHAELEFRSASIADLMRQRSEVSSRRTKLSARLSELRNSLHDIEKRRHQHELDANRVRLERDTLRQRVLDDYEVELSEIDASQVNGDDDEMPMSRDEIDQEIAELRRKISNVGAVNMAALEEVEQMQERYDVLASQYQDLVDAKNSLVKIINRINADSRRLFTETLEAIRENFQRMFRRVFGGGHADIVLEPDVDILEAGIDIVATPPGKHSLGISLLSGGERALTAVTLLLAIFEYRPSPFCVLDEVDGPLDEANIGRFTDVLREFLQWTKFVVVTHSKKTMTAATTLYGVTMQESGVSTKVSVQFDDVSDDGHIRREAIQRSSERAGDEDRGVA